MKTASTFVVNVIAIAGLLVFGFPLSLATIRMTLGGWALIAAVNIQLVLGRVMPQIRLLQPATSGRARVNDYKAMRVESGRLANTSGSRRWTMKTRDLFRKASLYAIAVTLCLAAAREGSAQKQNQDEEVELGQEAFNELKAKGEIIEASPLYDQLRPIADAITRAAQPRYNHPFKFYLVHETQPNAFATPGGNVYVTDSLLYFVKNTEELAGTLCHEVSHTIHRDSVTLLEKQERLEKREIGAAILLGPTRAHVLAILLLGKLHSLSYSRDVESRADLTGSDVCASAGYNPWGLVWLFQDFDNAKLGQVPQLLSDHPSNQNRVDALEEHFHKNPSVFGKFDPDAKSASMFSVPKGAGEVFLR